jgi:hypothetical protein
VPRIVGHPYDALTTPERLTYLVKLELEARRLTNAPGATVVDKTG